MDISSTLLLLGLVIALLILLRWRNQPHNLPPGPTALPLLGNILTMDNRAPFKTFLKWSKTYGPVMTVYLGTQRVLVLVGYDTVKEALVDNADDFIGRAPVPFLQKIVKGYDGSCYICRKTNTEFHKKDIIPTVEHGGGGIAISNGERWRQLRRFTLTTLRDFGMGRKRMEGWIQEESGHLLDTIKETNLDKWDDFKSCLGKDSLMKNKLHISWSIWKMFYDLVRPNILGVVFLVASPVDPTFYLSRAVSNIICALVFGERFSYEDCHFLRLLQVFTGVLQFGSSTWGQLYNIFPWLIELLPGKHRKVMNDVDEVMDFSRGKVQEHKDSLDPDNPRDFIDCFLIRLKQEKDNPNTEFHYENLIATVLNLFLAGTESTSTTIRYALMLLIKHPEIQTCMQKEIDTVIGRERSPSLEDRKSLPFTDAVIHEVQRYIDLVPLNVPHYTTHQITFRGYTIPKLHNCMGSSLPYFALHNAPHILNGRQDTVILPLLHSVLRDEEHWEKPWSFDPRHFLDKNGNFKKHPAFLPFSAGKRSCVGESLARMELFIFLVSLLQHFTFTTPGGPESVDCTPEISGFANLPRKYQLIATPR
ncbi:cytochrome P450 2G1-like precursor [Ictalurus punctatus]|uniref:Cytochrome P450 2G1-like precursor n=1 Tax=Ictalurus punctatus TaxID=7998 RepID=V5NWJ0_ICTPU|nr:cytochrome P450 2G1-like precursor [Ictalurus punctatus]AHA93074.1 cytochrome P450 CYP2Y8 [Ictalurus punctatus]